MKIINEGRPWKGVKVKCKCGAIFQLEESDKSKVTSTKKEHMGLIDDPLRWIVDCPTCSQAVFF